MTVTATYGGNASNAYVDHAMANSFLTTAVPVFKAWTDTTTVAREAAIIQATQDVDSRNYIGGRYYYDQTLEFPREIRVSYPWNRTATSSTVFDVTYARMENDVKFATCVQALWRLRFANSEHQDNRAFGIKAVSRRVGPIQDTFSYQEGSGAVIRLSPEALSYLAEWMTSKPIYRG